MGREISDIAEYVTSAKARFVRIAPRKVRIVADLIRGKEVGIAENILKFTPKRGAKLLSKLLKSAVAGVDKKEHPNPEELKVAKVVVDLGPTFKRFRPRAMGRAARIRKRTSHVTLLLTE